MTTKKPITAAEAVEQIKQVVNDERMPPLEKIARVAAVLDKDIEG